MITNPKNVLQIVLFFHDGEMMCKRSAATDHNSMLSLARPDQRPEKELHISSSRYFLACGTDILYLYMELCVNVSAQ